MVSHLNYVLTSIAGVLIVESTSFVDQRGAFRRLFCDQELEAVIGARRIMQINHSRTTDVGAVRGMHFQKAPHPEMKLVRCLKGRVFDVAVDLRAGSPTYLKWHGEELSADNAKMLVIPEGCAHGFQVLESDSELLYLHTACYEPAVEGGLRHDDPLIGIEWPIAVTQLSKRDESHVSISPEFRGISV